MRDYRREQSSALSQRFLAAVLPVPAISDHQHAGRPSWLARLLASDAVTGTGTDRSSLCQPQSLSVGAFNSKEVLSGASRQTLVRLKGSMTPRPLQYKNIGFGAADALEQLSGYQTPPTLEVSLMNVTPIKVRPRVVSELQSFST